MKHLFCFISALMIAATAFAAGDKVLEKSHKHAPDWIGGMEKDYIIVSTEAGNLEDAQTKAITKIREQIISAIATQVHSATNITMHEVTENGQIDSRREVKSELSVTAADIPYLADVSPSHAADYYWVKTQRADKSIVYGYHVKYPLSNMKLHQLVEEYEKTQKAVNDSLQSFSGTDFAAYNSLDEMLARHSQLKQFMLSLREDDPRRNICQSIRQNYERMMSGNIHVETAGSDRKQTEVVMMYGDKQIACSLTPKTKTNCLTAIETRSTGHGNVISYDYTTGCYDDEQNWLEVTYTIAGKKITQRCYINNDKNQ